MIGRYRKLFRKRSRAKVSIERLETDLSLDGIEIAAMRVSTVAGKSSHESHLYYLAPKGGGTLWQLRYEGPQPEFGQNVDAFLDSLGSLPF